MRRDWATLAPLRVAGGRPISLTAAPLAFVRQLATQQHLVNTARLSHVRQLDAPSGSFRGILSPTNIDDTAEGSLPTLHEPSPLPSIEHRHLAAMAAGAHDDHGRSALEQLLAIGDPLAGDDRPIGQANSAIDTIVNESIPEGGGASEGGRRSGLAASRRQGLGPAYHGPLPEAMRAERDRGPSEGEGTTFTEGVPGDVRAAMRDVLGVDIGDRLVHRGPAVSAEAQSMGAQAFTRDGQVFISDDVGPLDQAQAKATLAHELTHAAQQVVHGVTPDEGSIAGQLAEAHAQQVEQYVRGDGGAIKPAPEMLHARPRPGSDSPEAGLEATTRQMMRDLVDSGLARPDGTGGIIFTMPPSSMTGSAGTQRLTSNAATAPTVVGSHQDHWDPLATLGNTLGQGLANDVLGMAGSAFGFSDEFMGDQRGQLATQNLQFRREQTTRAYTELRMEHLRSAELSRRNAEESLFDQERTTTLDTGTLQAIDERINHEVGQRMQLLDEQAARALDQLNRQRASRQQEALRVIPEESYDAALHRLFDDTENDAIPPESEVFTALTANPGRSTGGRPTGGGPGSASGGPTGGPGAGAHGPASGGGPGGTGSPTGTPHGGPGTGTGSGAQHPVEHWRTDATMGGRFAALGAALGADMANAEIGIFGSMFGVDTATEDRMHAGIGGTSAAAHHGAAPAATPGTHPGAHPGDAAHHGAAAAGAHGAAAHGATHHDPGHEVVDHIVHDPYALDELAMRLYPSIRSRLRQELLIDRERAGLLADFR
jgi:hypothetical protein